VDGARTGGYAVFPASTRKILVKVGISFVSVANAEENAATEIPNWIWTGSGGRQRSEWNDKLGHIQVSGGNANSRRVFYSRSTTALLHPSIFSDVNGQYIGFDEKVHKVSQGHLQYAN